MKLPYEKPVLTRLQSGFMNKMSRSPAYNRRVRSHIDGVAIASLTEQYGSPLYIFSEKTLRQKHREMHRAFSMRYPDIVMGWSYKTNYLRSICAIMHQEGSIAEVVSEMEYEMARAMGVPGSQIIFNGPHKSAAILERAVLDGAIINVDHLDEIMMLEQLATRLKRTVTVGMRLNLDAGIYPQWSRFGFNLESGQAMDVAKRIVQGGKLKLNGLHCHIGTFILEPAAYARQIEKMVAFGYQLQSAFGLTMEYLDIGGGLPSRSRLKGSYLSADVGNPTVDEFAEAVSEALNRALKPGDFPKLILESGRALVDEAGYLVTSIVAAKRLPDGSRAYVADAGVNLLFTAYWYKFNIEVTRDVPGINENALLYGPLCMNIDVIDEGVLLPPLKCGDQLVISPVGAYNITQSMQFIEYRPAVVLIGVDGSVEVIREADDLTDVQRRDRLPARLADLSAPPAAIK